MREITLPKNDKELKTKKIGKNKWISNKIILGKRYNLDKIETWKYLVEFGANIHANDDSAIQWASGHGHLEIVRYLVENGANIHANNELSQYDQHPRMDI